MKYVYELRCPRCGGSSSITTENRDPPAQITCGDCMAKDAKTVEVEIIRVAIFSMILLMLLCIPGAAQQQTTYGPDGRVTTRTVTGSNGATVTYGPDGRVLDRSTTTSTGTVIYGPDGRRLGTVTPPPRR